MRNNAFSKFKKFTKKPKKPTQNIDGSVSAQGYYLSNPKFDMKQVLLLIGRNPNFNGMLIEGKPEDFEGFDENGNDRSRMAYYYVEQAVDMPVKLPQKENI